MLNRIPRRRLVDEAATAIRKAIIGGSFKPGERLPEDRLASMLGVSRTPLREAFRMLEEEGLVMLSPSRGVEVVRLDAREISNLFDLREILDGLAARNVADGARAEHIAALESVQEELRRDFERRDFDQFLIDHLHFHELMAKTSGNHRLQRLLPAISVSVQIYHPTLAREEHLPARTLAEHERILEAIRRGDGEAAEAAARAHGRTGRVELSRRLVAEDPRD